MDVGSQGYGCCCSRLARFLQDGEALLDGAKRFENRERIWKDAEGITRRIDQLKSEETIGN